MNITILDVIKCMTMGNNEAAIDAYASIYGVSHAEARLAVEAFNAFVVLPDQKPTEAPQQAPESILEPSQGITIGTKAPIDKWIIASIEPINNRDYWDWDSSEGSALITARSLIERGHTYVRISRVIAESQEKTILTIDL
jgi:hypothetical protein